MNPFPGGVLASPEDVTDEHARLLASATLAERRLVVSGWRVEFLGRGEEKAVYAVLDHNGRVFAVELIDENGYRNGRHLTGHYFLTLRVPGLTGVRFTPSAGRLSLTFTGLVKVRDFAPGYVWGRFQWRPDRQSRLDHLLTAWLQAVLGARFQAYRRHHDDVHERNVVFEVGRRGVPVVARDASGRVRLLRVRLAPIDLR